MYLLYILVGILLLGAAIGPVLYWDKGRRSLVLAIRSLWLHKMRAFLSVLGIIIGTGAVITLMAFGEGSMQEALNDIRKLGATNIIVRSRKPPENSATAGRSRVAVYGLTQDDYDHFAVLQQGGTITRMVPMRIFPQEMRRLHLMWTGRAVGTTAAYAEINDLPLALGRFLRPEDEENHDNVAVLGARVAQGLFPFENPLGKTLKLGQSEWVVVGVLKSRTAVGDTGGACFVGTEGRIAVDREELVADPPSLLETPLRPDEVHLYRSDSHSGNFLDCVRTRKQPICDAETAHRAVSVLLLGGIGLQLQRPLQWDPQQERFINDDEANRLLSAATRPPWRL